MLTARFLLLLCLVVSARSGQASIDKAAPHEPRLPVVDDNACPFEGCTFGKWIVTRDDTIFTSGKDDRKPVSKQKKR
jgi:hypothetical protein